MTVIFLDKFTYFPCTFWLYEIKLQRLTSDYSIIKIRIHNQLYMPVCVCVYVYNRNFAW